MKIDNYQLANRIIDYISDGYDDEEHRENVVNDLVQELSNDDNDTIKNSFVALCNIIAELEL